MIFLKTVCGTDSRWFSKASSVIFAHLWCVISFPFVCFWQIVCILWSFFGMFAKDADLASRVNYVLLSEITESFPFVAL